MHFTIGKNLSKSFWIV